jgi:hypothetical protein
MFPPDFFPLILPTCSTPADFRREFDKRDVENVRH